MITIIVTQIVLVLKAQLVLISSFSAYQIRNGRKCASFCRKFCWNVSKPGIGTGPGWTRAGLARQQIPGSGPGSGLGFWKFRAPGRAPGWGAGLRDPGKPVFFKNIFNWWTFFSICNNIIFHIQAMTSISLSRVSIRSYVPRSVFRKGVPIISYTRKIAKIEVQWGKPKIRKPNLISH